MKTLMVPWAGVLLLAGCSFLSMRPLEIIRWEPAEDVVLEPSDLTVLVEFSKHPEQVSAEAAFSFSENDIPVSGSYTWKGAVMFFNPENPVETGRNYTIRVTTEAEDPSGNSLAEGFTFSFSTHDDHEPPVVLAMEPEDHGKTDDPLKKVKILFSEPVNPASLVSSFSIHPGIEGRISLSQEGTIVEFAPTEPLKWQTEYTVTISDELSDRNSNFLNSPFESRFSVGTDTTAPFVESGGNEEHSFLLTPYHEDESAVIAEGWECSWNISLGFSEKIDPGSLEQGVTIEPSWMFDILQGDPASGREFILTGTGRMEYGRIYTLSVNSGVSDLQGNRLSEPVSFSFLTSGSRSAPPEVTRVTYLSGPAEGTISSLSPYGVLDISGYAPHTGTDRGFFDIYVDLAEGAEIDIYSWIEAFSITCSNTCADILPIGVETGTYTGPAPVPAADSFINEKVVRVHVNIEDNIQRSGIITLKLNEEFKDSLGNPVEGDWLFPCTE